MKKKEFNQKKIDEMYNLSGMSISEIACILNTTNVTLRKAMVDYGFKIDSNRKFFNKPITLNKEQEEILFGGLLGDCCLTKNGRNDNNAQIIYTSSVKDHVEYFKSFFTNISSNESKNLIEKKYLDKRTKKEYSRYIFRSILNKTLTEYMSKWYKDGTKIIPDTLKLTPKMCLIWYLGDGSIQNHYKDKRTDLIKLSTNSFTEKEITNILLPQLIDFEAYIGFTEKKQPVIRIPRRKVKKFLDYIGDCPVETYKYKWEIFDYTYEKYKQNEK
jgi:hypothetical protein